MSVIVPTTSIAWPPDPNVDADLSPLWILLAFIAGLAIPLWIVRRAFRWLRPKAVIEILEKHREPAPQELLAERRATLRSTEQRARWDQLLREIRETTRGKVKMGHVEWIAQVLDGQTAPSPIPTFESPKR